MITAALSTTANPIRARRALRTFPSRKAVVMPRAYTLFTNGIRCPSTNETAAASTQYAAGAPNGKRRRAKSGSTMIARAATPNHTPVSGARGESRRNASSSMAVIVSSTISASSPYVRGRNQRLLTS